MSTRLAIFSGLFLCLLWAGAQAGTAAPAGAKVYIISPADGDVVSSPVTVKFGLSGMGVAPAGVDKPNTGLKFGLTEVFL